ncbi:hypothetical protein [uncultured Draconibacterium sp.]|uniref:hypothetical protein n=1 Tax=uncultured Draconibacterium sp. TaxID=1573823 RepID=UPI0025EC07BC|nr:hypothetical protein [uncultured Draconibacterium sp.]
MKNRIKYLGILALLVIALCTSAQDFEVEVVGNIEFNNLQVSVTEAGLNYTSAVESTSDVMVSIKDVDALGKKTNPNKKWTLSVRKEEAISDAFTVLVVRTGKGSRVGSNGSSNIKGGEVYQEVSTTKTYFFHGMGEISDIPIRFKLEDLSVLSGAGNNQFDITITVDEGWK